ncbi:unnamed protein product [Mytilus edulis]|uniref:Fatty acid synthase n=2 Tax=Mytilus TaxID=6548 RepID=A0A8S3UU42_MYTED|nr:unnamed protein product [Mytilus edulis]
MSPTVPDNPLKNKFYEIRWQPVSFDRKFENDIFVSNALIVTVEAKAQQMMEKYLPDSKGITVSSHIDEICNNVIQDLYDYVMTTFGNFQNISEIVYCPRCSDCSGENMSPEDIFNTVKTSCVILTKLCQKLIHEKVDVVMLKLVNNEEVLQRHNLSKSLCLIKQWLVTNTAVGILQKIPIACGNGRTFSFDTKDKDDIVDTVRRLDVASTRNDLFGKHSSYVVVGGLTGLGQEIVKLICELGGGAVFIFGRRNPTDEQTAWMQTLMDIFTCKIEFVETDITDILSLKNAFEMIRMKYSSQPIKGVFQGAAVLDDGTILNMTELKLDKVLRPKVLGTWNLHMVTKDMDLDYFVLHSSTASAFGNVGQLNYGAGNSFMDAVSFYRQSTGLSGQTINWGPLQLGLMKVKDGLEQFFDSQGYNSLTRTDIRECFLYLLIKNSIQVICATIDWKTVIRQTADVSIMSRVVPILRELRILDIFIENSQITNILMDTDDLLKLSTQKQIQETIRITSVIAADVFAVEMSILTPSTNLVSIGMDSMKGLEFVNSVNKRVHVRLPVVSVLAEYATIESISNLILEHLISVNSKPGQVPVQKLRELRGLLENFRTPLTDIEKSYVDPITDMKNADSFVDIQLCVEKNLHKTNLLITCLEQLGKLHPFVLSEYYIDSGETYRILQNETMLKLLENIEAKHRELNLEFYRQPRDLDLLSGDKFDLKILTDHELGINKIRTINMKKTEKLIETKLLFASKSVREDDTQLLNLRFRRFYFDFRSIEIFVNDLFTIISNDVSKENNKLQQNKYTKTDVIERMLCSTDTKMEYWRSKLGNNYQPMCLPNFDQAKSSDQTMIIRRLEMKGKIIENITKWTLLNNASIKDLFLTAYQLLLHFISKSGTPSVVTNVDLREEDDCEQYEGPLESLIPIIANVDTKDKSVQEFVLENLKEIELVTSKLLISHSVIESLSKDRRSLMSIFKHAVLYDKDISQGLTSSKLGIRPVQVVSMDSRFSTSIHVITDCTQRRNWLEFQCHQRFADETTASAILDNLLDLAHTIVMDQSISLHQLHAMFIIKIKTDDKFKNVHFGTEKAQFHENNEHRIRRKIESEELDETKKVAEMPTNLSLWLGFGMWTERPYSSVKGLIIYQFLDIPVCEEKEKCNKENMTAKYSKDCITKNIVFIKENIASVDRLLDILLEGDVIQMHEREDVVAKMPGERVHHMIDIVLKRRAQHIFIDALKRTGQTLIVDRILNTQRELAQIKEPKPHTISLLTPKIATYAPFHREHTSLWQQKENMIERKSHDEYKSLLEIKRQNEARIKQLEHEMEKVRRTERKRYKQLEKEYRELTRNNNELKAKVDELKIQLNARDEFIKTARSRSSYGQDEVDSSVKHSDSTFLDLKKSQENFENKLMKEMAKGQQQLLNIVQELSQKNVIQEKKLAEATDKLETATAKLNSVAEKIDNRLDGHDGRKSTSKSSASTNLSEMTLPPLNKLGKHFSDGLTRQNTFMDGVGVPHKFKE